MNDAYDGQNVLSSYGEVPKELGSKFTVDTKIYTNTQTDGSGDLSSEAIEKSVNTSLQRLQRVEGVSWLLCAS